jgi:hypothetical protein
MSSRPESIADIIPPAYNPDAVCFDARKREAAKDAEIAELKAKLAWLDDIQTMTQSQLNEWSEIAKRHGKHHPHEIDEYIGDLCVRIVNLESNAELPLGAQPAQESARYIITELEWMPVVFRSQEKAKVAAAMSTIDTGRAWSVLRIVDTCESVKIEWESKK